MGKTAIACVLLAACGYGEQRIAHCCAAGDGGACEPQVIGYRVAEGLEAIDGDVTERDVCEGYGWTVEEGW